MTTLTQTLEYNQRTYHITVDTKAKKITVNGYICELTEYDDRVKAIYGKIPDEYELLMVIVYKNRCYIFEYDPQRSLKENANGHIFVELKTPGKILLCALFIIPLATISVLFKKSIVYAMCVAIPFCALTLLVTSIVKLPTIEQKKKRIIFLSLLSAIVFLISCIGLSLYYSI